MATNKLLPFANGEETNVLDYERWNALPARKTGFQSGIAKSAEFNYILAQGGAAGYVLGQLVVEHAQKDATLNATDLYTAFKAAIAAYVPGAVANGSIDGAKLKDGTVALAKLAANSVDASKIVDGSVGTAELAANAVTAEKIGAGQVTDGKLGANSINTTNIKNDQISTEKLKNATVTEPKLANASVSFDKVKSEAIATDAEAKAGAATNKLMTPKATAAAIAAQIPPAVPSGTMIPFAGKTIPDGWLLCNGAAVSRTTYAALFAAIGTSYGAGDSSTTFNLPNLHERFIEGTTTAGDVGKNVEAGLPNITGGFVLDFTPSTTVSTSGAFSFSAGNYNDWTGTVDTRRQSTKMAFSSSRISGVYKDLSTVQPSSVHVLVLIKI